MALAYSPEANRALASGGASARDRPAESAKSAAPSQLTRLLRILMTLDEAAFGVHDLDSHSVLQVNVAGQGNEFLDVQPAGHLVVIGVGNSDLDFALIQHFVADAVFHHKDVALAAFGS